VKIKVISGNYELTPADSLQQEGSEYESDYWNCFKYVRLLL